MLKRIICRIIGHKYRLLRRFSAVERKISCDRCGRTWGMHDTARALVPWDSDLDALHAHPPRPTTTANHLTGAVKS